MTMRVDWLKKNKKILIGMIVVCIMLVGGLSITSQSAPTPKELIATQTKLAAKSVEQNDAFKEKINGTLSGIDQKLSLVIREMETVASSGKESAPDNALNNLSQTMISFKEEAARSLIKSHEENEALTKKIQALQEVILSLKGSKKSIEYLDQKALPFDIVAIDSVNEEPVLALRYNYHYIALEKGEKLAGWKVIRLDYARQLAEFDDEKGAHVRLSLSRPKEEGQSWA